MIKRLDVFVATIGLLLCNWQNLLVYIIIYLLAIKLIYVLANLIALKLEDYNE